MGVRDVWGHWPFCVATLGVMAVEARLEMAGRDLVRPGAVGRGGRRCGLARPVGWRQVLVR